MESILRAFRNGSENRTQCTFFQAEWLMKGRRVGPNNVREGDWFTE